MKKQTKPETSTINIMTNKSTETENEYGEQHQLVQISAQVNTLDGSLKGKVTIYTGPTQLAELVPPLQALTEGLVNQVVKREQREGRQITCQAGCGTCCCQMVPLSIPEVFYLRDLVNSLPPEGQQAFIKRFDSIVDVLKHQGLYDELNKPDIGDEEHLNIAKRYFQLKLPCPFLNNGICTIHPVRPLACREYHVTTPAEWCSDPYSYPIKKPKFNVAMPVVLARLSAGLLEMPVKLIPLTLALDWAEKNIEIHKRTWPGKWLFERFLAYSNSPTGEPPKSPISP